MKALRILLVFKFIKNGNKKWAKILDYWYAVNLNTITHNRWNNNFPHNQDINNIPKFFRKCLIEFKDYCTKFGFNNDTQVDSKKIHINLQMSRNHVPASIIKYPENTIY